MPAYRLAIFDYDGTLADSFPWFCSVLNDTARKFGFREVAESEVDELRALGSREIVARLGVPMWKMPAIAIHMRKLSAASRSEIALFPGARELLGELAGRGISVAIVSSNGEEVIRHALGPAAAHVTQFDCGSSLWGKAAKFKAVLEHAGIDRGDAIAIGDEIRDIDAARSAEIAAGVVTFGYNTGAALRAHRPEHVFNSYADVLAALTP
jgi:phosphoglycolate phosphatase